MEGQRWRKMKRNEYREIERLEGIKRERKRKR